MRYFFLLIVSSLFTACVSESTFYGTRATVSVSPGELHGPWVSRELYLFNFRVWKFIWHESFDMLYFDKDGFCYRSQGNSKGKWTNGFGFAPYEIKGQEVHFPLQWSDGWTPVAKYSKGKIKWNGNTFVRREFSNEETMSVLEAAKKFEDAKKFCGIWRQVSNPELDIIDSMNPKKERFREKGIIIMPKEISGYILNENGEFCNTNFDFSWEIVNGLIVLRGNLARVRDVARYGTFHFLPTWSQDGDILSLEVKSSSRTTDSQKKIAFKRCKIGDLEKLKVINPCCDNIPNALIGCWKIEQPEAFHYKLSKIKSESKASPTFSSQLVQEEKYRSSDDAIVESKESLTPKKKYIATDGGKKVNFLMFLDSGTLRISSDSGISRMFEGGSYHLHNGLLMLDYGISGDRENSIHYRIEFLDGKLFLKNDDVRFKEGQVFRDSPSAEKNDDFEKIFTFRRDNFFDNVIDLFFK